MLKRIVNHIKWWKKYHGTEIKTKSIGRDVAIENGGTGI